MNKENFVKELYQAIDSMNTQKLVSSMTQNGTFRFANMPGVVGSENITAFLNGFFQSIKSIRHSELESWFVDKVVFVTGNVTYTRPDDFSLTVPFSVLLKMDGELIHEWLIFVDNSPLYQ